MTDPDDGAATDTTVAGVAHRLWGVRPSPAIPRYAERGWQLSPHTIDRRCPVCTGQLHGLYRVAGNVGKARLQAAVVCPSCPASFKLSDLQLAQRAVLGELKPDAVARRLQDDQRLNRLAVEQRARPEAVARDHPAPTAPRAPRVIRPVAPGVPAAGTEKAVAPQSPDTAEREPGTAAPLAPPPARRTSTTVTAAKIRRILADTGSTGERGNA